eukprot:1156398-Pelagomonas_calceolata.AAC.3
MHKGHKLGSATSGCDSKSWQRLNHATCSPTANAKDHNSSSQLANKEISNFCNDLQRSPLGIKEEKRKDYANQVQLRALRKGP